MRVGALALAALTVTQALGGEPSPLSASELKAAKIHYVPAAELKVFPLPVFTTDCAGLAAEKELADLRANLLVPIILYSERPISSVRLDLCGKWPQGLSVATTFLDGGYLGVFLSKPDVDRFDYSWWLQLAHLVSSIHE